MKKLKNMSFDEFKIHFSSIVNKFSIWSELDSKLIYDNLKSEYPEFKGTKDLINNNKHIITICFLNELNSWFSKTKSINIFDYYEESNGVINVHKYENDLRTLIDDKYILIRSGRCYILIERAMFKTKKQ